MRECDFMEQVRRERDYLSARLEEATKELARLDLLNLTLTRQKKQALATFHLIRCLHGRLEQAFTIGDLYNDAVTVLTSELAMDASALLKINHETREISILASVGLSAPENTEINLDEDFTKEEFQAPTFVNSKSSLSPFQEFIRSHFAFPYFVWYPIVDEEDGMLVLYSGNKSEDLVSRQPFSEESLETFGAISSVILLRRDNIAKTREILRKKEERIDFLAEILKTSPISVVATDKDENITYCNPAAEKLLGYREAELLGKHPALLNAEAIAASIEKEIRDTVGRGGVWRGEIKCRKKNGTLFYNHLSVCQIRDREGNAIAMIRFQEDVTDRKRAEEALRESEEIYRAIFKNTGTASIIIEEDTTISLANAEFARLTGYSEEEIEGKKSWREFVAKDDLETTEKYHDARRVDPDAAPRKYELKIVDRRGNVRDIIVTVDLIPGTKKSVASALDITERKRMTEALEESERRYRLLAENVTDVIWTMDLDLQFTYISPSVRLLLGYGPEEAVTLSAEQFLTTPSLEIALNTLEEELNIEKMESKDPSRSRVLELKLKRKDGSTVWAEAKVTFLRGPAGRPFGILGVARNVAERKQAEEAIKQRNRELSVLNAVACTVSQSLETDAIVNEALKKLVDLMSIDMAGIRLTSEAKLRLAFAADCKVSYLEEMAEGIGLEDPALKPVFEERRPITLDRYPHNGGRKRDGRSECFAIVPVASKGTVHGILLVHKEAVSPFSLDEIELFTTVGNQIGIAVDNSWLYQELKKQYIFTTMLIDTMPDGMGVLDERGRVEFANRRLLQLLGYSLQESLGTHWTSLIHPSDHSLVRAQRRSRKSARPSTYECRVLRRSGDAIPVLISWAPRLDGKRQYQGAIGIVTDITERKEAEEALREYEARYVHLVDHMPDGVALVSRRRIIRVNPSMAQLFGFPSPDSMQGLRATDLAAPASKGIMNKRSTLRTLGKKGRNCFEFQALRKDGSTFPAEVTLTVDRSERRPFVLAIIRDVSERKTHERLRKRLSGRILTAQEKERALIARELHDELGQALTGIKMDMSWIKRRVKGADDAISNRFEDLGNLIDTAIDSVRKMASNLRPSVLDKLGLMAAVEWYAAEFERRTGIECTVRAKPSISNIGENLAINAYRIVQEALTNVARHSGASHVDVEIAQHQRHLAISISDNGRGIPSQRGSGWKSLGIENMRERAELLRGKLDIKRRRPRGTKVSAYFPLPSGQE